MFNNILGTAHNHSRDAVGFQMAGDRTYGLVAHRSIRHQDGGIGSVLLTWCQDTFSNVASNLSFT